MLILLLSKPSTWQWPLSHSILIVSGIFMCKHLLPQLDGGFLKPRGWAFQSFVPCIFQLWTSSIMTHNEPIIIMNYALLLWIMMIIIMTHYSYLLKIPSKLKVHNLLSFPWICVESRQVYFDSGPKAPV